MVNTRRTLSERVDESPQVQSPIDPGIGPESTPSLSQTQLPSLEAQLRAAQEAIARLERERLEDLRPIRPHFTADSVGKGRDIKIEDIATFTVRFSIQKRHEWLINLELAFEAAPYRFSTERSKVLGGLAHMDNSCRTKWVEHLSEQPPEEERIYTESWTYFKDWTLGLIQNATNLKADIRERIEVAYQKSGQDPREFHTYLHSLEQHLQRECEENRSLTFFAKLLPELKKEISKHVRPLPITRDQMVETAVHYWNITKSESRPKRSRSDDQSPSRQKRSKFDRGTQNPGRTDQSTGEKPNHPRNGRDRQIRCYTCGSPDHIRPDCPQNAKAQEITQKSKTTKNDSESD
ncbi:hypothetical protein N7486_008072 [Penicillium sp. IBT 16267x]|nr:hypothetical protein N7486_008072 [Penicillium sp. IBT 16267x]